MRPHVFGIGLSRTGTRSLCRALELLGWKAAHCTVDGGGLITPDRLDDQQYTAAADITVAGRFEEYAERYPDARFVYTVRPTGEWAEAIRRRLYEGYPANLARARDIGDPLCEVFSAAYNEPPPQTFDAAWWAARYVSHTARVFDYFFRHRARELSVLAITAGEGWDMLCPFLDVPIPAEPFPHERSLG